MYLGGALQNGVVAIASTEPRYMLFGCNYGLFASSIAGSIFSYVYVPTSTTNPFVSNYILTISGNGQHAYVANSGDTALYASHDKLKSFQQKFPKLPNQDIPIAIYDIALSTDGSILYVMSLSRLFMGKMSTTAMDVWTELRPHTININPSFQSISTSTNGQYVTLISDGLLYISKQYGKTGTWHTDSKSPCIQLQRATISLSSNDIYAIANGYMCHTSDYGIHIGKISAPPLAYKAVAVDGSGKLIVGVSQEGSIVKSSDGGVTWSPNYYDWVDLVMSHDGQTTVALSGYSNNGFVAMTTNNGGTWLQTAYESQRSYTSIACDARCQYIILAFGNSQYLVLSNDYGKTWRQVMIKQGTFKDGPSLLPLAVSSSGKYMTTAQYSESDDSSGGIFVSSDFGMNWKPAENCPRQRWLSLAMSSSGKIQVAGPYRKFVILHVFFIMCLLCLFR